MLCNYGQAVQSGFVTSSPEGGGQKINFVESLTKTCYDGCDFVGSPPDIYLGKVRRSETRILGTPDWLQTTFTYDDHGRVALSESNHHLNIGNLQADSVLFKYDYADNITYQNRLHHLSDGRYTRILEKMAYDHSGRLIRNHHQVDGSTDVMLSSLSYTVKDQIAEKNIGKVGSSFLQSVDFDYLDNGFLTSINQPTLGGTNLALGACPPELPTPGAPSGSLDNNDLFYLQLHYDSLNTSFGSNKEQYNGNISQISWRIRGRERQVYGFEYDWQDRLTASSYGDQSDAGTLTLNDRFSTTYEYDLRGNIEKLTREGYYWNGSCWTQSKIDSLSYSYIQSGGKTTNRLKKVTEQLTTSGKEAGFKAGAGGDYTYDSNGNMIYDPNKDMDILYNYLNLPKRIEIEDCKFIEFLYDASGTKLRKTLKEGAMVIRTHDYLGGLEYTNDSLEAIYHSEGRVYFENGIARYEYNLTDHLGNTRVTFTDKDGDGVIEIFENADSNEVLSESHYYPFGMQMNGAWMSNPGRSTKYRFNGIERNEDFNLNWDLADFRAYDPAIGRWMQIDPLAEYANDITPYRFGFNSPILYVDPFGLFESRQAAKDYADEHGVKRGLFSGNRIRRQKDGSFAIVSKTRIIQKDQEIADLISNGEENDGVVISANVTAPKGGVKRPLSLPGEYAERTYNYQGLLGQINYTLWGGTQDGIQYNRQGYPTGLAPQGGAGAIALIGGGGGLQSASQLLKSGSSTVQQVRGNLYIARSGTWLNPSGKVSYAGGFISAESKLLKTASKYDLKASRGLPWKPYVAPPRKKKAWELILEAIGRNVGAPGAH